MRLLVQLAVCLIAIEIQALWVHAHGTPINVGANSTNLVVSGGEPGGGGHVSHLFFEDDEDGDGEISPIPVPGVGDVILWEIPGFNISGLNTQSSLSIEVLAPTVADNPPQRRTLWYWNPDEGVVPAESNYYFLGSEAQQTISPDDTHSLAPMLLVDPVGGTAAQGGQQGFHNHGLLTYALDNNSPPAIGAYGLFARLTSSHYQPSNPFLIVFNYGVEYELMLEAALAINAAAADDSLPGDFNHDGTVDAADYVVWRKSAGSAAEFAQWRGNFGATGGGGASVAGDTESAPASVPEPALSVLAGLAIGLFVVARRAARFN
jgi:hypothetical protein